LRLLLLLTGLRIRSQQQVAHDPAM
jgi:hypothetical protein